MTEETRYDLLQELGRGGMGIVYKAMDRETSEFVAIKVLRPEVVDDQFVMQRFKNELRIARKITHKSAVFTSSATSAKVHAYRWSTSKGKRFARC